MGFAKCGPDIYIAETVIFLESGMRAKPLIILLTIIVFGLVHLELDAMDSKSVGSSPVSTATELSGNPQENDPLRGPRNGFAKGTRKWQTYASAAAGDNGKGEMYALHLGYGYFLMDYLSINLDVLGAYIRSGLDDNGVAVGLDVIFRRHFSPVEDYLWSVYLDLGGGLQQHSTNIAGNRHFNFRVMSGGGATLRVGDHARMRGGMRYLHLSDAGIEGGGGGFDGFMFYGGVMFPF
mgnify:CR=1 FL=1